MTLRRDIAKLAHEDPTLRADLVLLLRQRGRVAFNKENPVELLSQIAKVLDSRGFKALSKKIKESDIMKAIRDAVDKQSGVANMNDEEKAVWIGRVGREVR